MRTAVTFAALTIAATLAFAADRPRKTSPTKAKVASATSLPGFQEKRAKAAEKMSLDNAAAVKAQYLNYAGTKITTSSKIELPAAVAKKLEAADWKSPARLAYFDWLKNVPNLRCNGWNGLITKANAVEGGYVVNVSFTPILAIPEAGGHVSTAATFHEVYEVSAQGVNYVSGVKGSTPTILFAY